MSGIDVIVSRRVNSWPQVELIRDRSQVTAESCSVPNVKWALGVESCLPMRSVEFLTNFRPPSAQTFSHFWSEIAPREQTSVNESCQEEARVKPNRPGVAHETPICSPTQQGPQSVRARKVDIVANQNVRQTRELVEKVSLDPPLACTLLIIFKSRLCHMAGPLLTGQSISRPNS